MDFEVVGRHALLFDDDATAAFVNSGDALVDWHSLQIDRYDVRHLLSSPPPSRRRNRYSKPVFSDDSSLESQLDHERYLDLPSHPDQPGVEEDEHRTDTLGYHNVGFSYGDADVSADKKNVDAGMESSGFLPSFAIPDELLQSLPPTEKVHQIIARTALFVSKNGGQSEIILRVKQGDNPTFGFLMPGHHLHAYFRFLVEHPELVHSESDGKSQDEQKKSASDHNGVDGALTLLGSVYGSGEEEDGDDDVEPEKDDVSHDSTHSRNSHSSMKIDEPVSKNPILSNRDKVFCVKKNTVIIASKSGTAKGVEEKSCLLDKAKRLTTGMTCKIEPVILEPPPELKRLIDKLAELIMRNGEQFEATLIEQNNNHGKFSFLLPSNPYHSYYLKVLQMAQESKLNCKGFSSGTNGDKKACVLNEKDFSDMPPDSDRKEKFKMVIGKSKKETQDAETQQECGIDTATAAALLQSATRGIKDNSNSQITSISSVNNSEGAVQKSDQNRSCDNVSADSEVAHLTEEQKKAERLKRAKMFVAMLKSREVPFTAGASRASSQEPPDSGGEVVNLDCKKREPSADIDGPSNYFGEHTERLSKRKYRPRSEFCGGDDDDDGDNKKEHSGRHSKKRNPRSRSRRRHDDEGYDHRRRHRTHFSSDEHEDEGKSSEDKYEDDKNHKRARKKHHRRRRHRTHSYSDESSEEDKNRKRTSKKHRSHHSSRERDDDDERDEKRSGRKKHRSSHRSSRDKHRQNSRRCKESRSGDEHEEMDKNNNDERNELEEGEIGVRVSEESRGIASGDVNLLETSSVDVLNSNQGVPSQPSETAAEVPDDLRAKIRAMLMSTCL
ncbi:splicing factor suppressor of white-apricot homolog [Phtheirospermum japonicum]|uniref:Splicing factor suppressor of white-apricot homolog n=1 Tax=Phtheirospermum japonicum TaxID=374723 RepID=A0A830BL16_9LAMI|nr:splicing factor suppressor of white-apricot homolog [Phtheirospermum japonicum]